MLEHVLERYSNGKYFLYTHMLKFGETVKMKYVWVED